MKNQIEQIRQLESTLKNIQEETKIISEMIKKFEQEDKTSKRETPIWKLVLIPVLIIILTFGIAAICEAQSGSYWQYKQKGGLETYTKYKMGWPAATYCAVYQSGNPTKASYIKRHHAKRKRQYLRSQRRKRFFKRLF